MKKKRLCTLSSIERAEAETYCNSDISDDKNEGLAHHMPCHLLTAPCLTNTVKQNLDESNQTRIVFKNCVTFFLFSNLAYFTKMSIFMGYLYEFI